MSINALALAASLALLLSVSSVPSSFADQIVHAGSSESSTSTALPAERAAPKYTETKYAGWQIDNGKFKISCIDPHAACADSEKVLDTLKILFTAYSNHDLSTAADYMDDQCTTFDEGTKQLISGKKAVLDDLKLKLDRGESKTDPLLSYTIEHPYAKVTGDVAVASFVAHKELGGDHPRKLESHCTDIFVKQNGKWKLLHYRRSWKEV